MDFKGSTVYQIYPKSFYDSNGDGIGDIRGIIEKLDYIQSLGADYIWSTPFFASPMQDNGYDVEDYRSIHPLFGTMEDVEELIEKARERGIGLMFDMVFNHTSTRHEWFQKALAGDPKYMDYYIFKDGEPGVPPTNWQSKFGGTAWEYVPYLKKWYLHLFDVTQADLNWSNAAVREELKNVIRFWKEKGVKGFRFDVVNLISKPEVFTDDDQGDGRRFYSDGPRVHEYLKELTADTQIGNMITVGEMSSTSVEHCIRYSDPGEKELSMCFNFHHLKVDYFNGNKWELAKPDYCRLKTLLETWQLQMQQHHGWNALFWSNHDQPRIVSRLGEDKKYWKQSAKMLAACMYLLRGTPYIYQGEELGMTNVRYKMEEYRDIETLNLYQERLEKGYKEEEIMASIYAKSRDNARTPMQWDDGENAGFTAAAPWIRVNPNYKEINAAAQTAAEDSVFGCYRKLIRLRKEYPVFVDGEFRMLLKEDENIFAYTRTDSGSQLLVVCNFYDKTIDISLKELDDAGELLVCSYKDAGQTTVLRPYEARMYWKKS